MAFKIPDDPKVKRLLALAAVAAAGVAAYWYVMWRPDHAEVVGISSKPALVSGQELAWRLSRPHDWARANGIPFDRFRGLDRVRIVHGTLTGLDLSAHTVLVRHQDGSTSAESYDALVISTGVANGFWRRPNLQSAHEIGADLRAVHDRLAGAGSVIVQGRDDLDLEPGAEFTLRALATR